MVHKEIRDLKDMKELEAPKEKKVKPALKDTLDPLEDKDLMEVRDH